jgi:hypothetical protein
MLVAREAAVAIIGHAVARFERVTEPTFAAIASDHFLGTFVSASWLTSGIVGSWGA